MNLIASTISAGCCLWVVALNINGEGTWVSALDVCIGGALLEVEGANCNCSVWTVKVLSVCLDVRNSVWVFGKFSVSFTSWCNCLSWVSSVSNSCWRYSFGCVSESEFDYQRDYC